MMSRSRSGNLFSVTLIAVLLVGCGAQEQSAAVDAGSGGSVATTTRERQTSSDSAEEWIEVDQNDLLIDGRWLPMAQRDGVTIVLAGPNEFDELVERYRFARFEGRPVEVVAMARSPKVLVADFKLVSGRVLPAADGVSMDFEAESITVWVLPSATSDEVKSIESTVAELDIESLVEIQLDES